MIMNLFNNEKSVIKTERLFQLTYLKSSSYKKGTKHARIYTGFNFVESQHLAMKPSLSHEHSGSQIYSSL